MYWHYNQTMYNQVCQLIMESVITALEKTR